MTSKDEKYNMEHEKRGIALIININKYDNPNPYKLEEREWSKKDVENLKKTLNYLEFDLDLPQKLKKSEIEERLKQIASFDHKDFDCFLCVVMSHGNEDNIVTRDNKLISFEEIMAPIKLCPTLENKPKMFFFQACRGENKMNQRPPTSKSRACLSLFSRLLFFQACRRENKIESRASSASSTNSSRGERMSDFASSSNLQSNVNKNIETKFESESDLLIYFSTLPNHLSWSVDKNEGTIFIKSFCDVFNDAYKNLPNNMSLAQMITRINKSVSEKRLQVPVPEFRINKEIKFLPKEVSLVFNFSKP